MIQISIKTMRMARNMTQENLAVAIGVKQEAISQWETKKTRPAYENLILIAKALECTLDDLVRDD